MNKVYQNGDAGYITDFKDMLKRSVRFYGKRNAFTVKKAENGKIQYRDISYIEFQKEIDRLGTALLDLGLKGKNIAVMGENRYEWCLSYLAVTCGCGCIVPVDKELKRDEIHMILSTANVSAIIYSGKMLQKDMPLACADCENIKYMINMDDHMPTPDVLAGKNHMTVASLLEKGRTLLDAGDVSYTSASIDPHSMSVLIFTSGTTGVAKGVMLSQRNICADIEGVTKSLDNDCTDVVLSILPMHHTYECTCDFLVIMYMGARMTFCDGIRYIAKNIQEYKPTIVMLVPLILENVYSKIIKQAKSNIFKYIVFRILLFISGIFTAFDINIGRRLFPAIHQSLGGNLRLIIAGAAAMSPKITTDMIHMGFKVRQGYGLTECSPIVCVNRDRDSAPNSVGPAIPGVTAVILNPDDENRGEIAVKGENVMLGYYNNPEATAACFKDGWFLTGDQGRIDKKGRVFVTGRIKNIIVNKTGKNIYPEELEALLAKIPYILECVVWGDNTSSEEDTLICATVVPNPEAIEKAHLNVGNTEAVHDLIWNEIKRVNKGLATYKKIQRLDIRKEAFEKTTTQKIKRYLSTLKDHIKK